MCLSERPLPRIFFFHTHGFRHRTQDHMLKGSKPPYHLYQHHIGNFTFSSLWFPFNLISYWFEYFVYNLVKCCFIPNVALLLSIYLVLYTTIVLQYLSHFLILFLRWTRFISSYAYKLFLLYILIKRLLRQKKKLSDYDSVISISWPALLINLKVQLIKKEKKTNLKVQRVGEKWEQERKVFYNRKKKFGMPTYSVIWLLFSLSAILGSSLWHWHLI